VVEKDYGVLMCVICNEPITETQRPYYEVSSGRKAHLKCFLDQDAIELEKERQKQGS
jgi:hypothetical protein